MKRFVCALFVVCCLASVARAQVLESVSVTLNDAQIKALPSAAVTVVASPGANRVLVPIAAFMRLNATGGAYGSLASNRAILISYLGGNAAFNPMHAFPHGAATDKAGPLAVTSDDGYGSGSNYMAVSVYHNTANTANQPLVIHAINDTNGDFTGGHPANTLTVVVVFVTVDL